MYTRLLKTTKYKTELCQFPPFYIVSLVTATKTTAKAMFTQTRVPVLLYSVYCRGETVGFILCLSVRCELFAEKALL